MIRSLASIEVLGGRKPHGTRLRYMAGCKCLICRAANSNYETMRAARRRVGLWNGLVPARRARRHMLALSRRGVGRRTVSLITRISETVLFNIRSGQQKHVRALNERAILSVSDSAVRGSTHVQARATWRKIDWLIDEGFSKAAIARMMGCKTPALQLRRDLITASSARKIDEIYRRFQ